MFNPDYPTTNTGGFLMHTYQQPQQNNDMFYYNGAGVVNPFATNMDSRRNMYTGYGNMPTMTAQTTPVVSEQQVMPFSTYPAGSGVTAPQTMNVGFNALAESRRNCLPVANNTNPWATTAQQPVQTPMCNPMYMTPQYGYGPMQTCNALYGETINGFDKKSGAWDNMYTNPRAVAMPNIDWNAMQHNQMMQQQFQYQGIPQYPVAAYPQTNMTWKEIAERNWG